MRRNLHGCTYSRKRNLNSVSILGFVKHEVATSLVLTVLNKGDCILCQVTSKRYDSNSVELNQADFKEGSLQHISYARPGKLFTANAILLRQQAGQLTETCFFALREQVVKTIRGEAGVE